MLNYDIAPEVEAFSTHRADALTFPVCLPLHQAHSARVVRVPATDEEITGVDALVTNQPGLRIGVKTADCVPILLHDPVRKAVAAVHSGWKGTVQNILKASVETMCREFGTHPADLRAVIGPCIHQPAFEVGDEVYERFVQAGYASFANRMPGLEHPEVVKWHIDLPAVCRQQLQETGVHHVEVRPECTFVLHQQFYSARRLGPDFGKQRIWNCIMLR